MSLRSEIAEQPVAVRRLLEVGWPEARTLARPLAAGEHLTIAGRGSSDNAATYGKYLFESLAGLVTALGGTGAPDFVWITPNLANDMHSGTVQQGDAWLKANLGPVLASPWFTGGDATVVVTMDENDAQSTPGGGQVPLVVISRNTTGKGSVTVSRNHYGMLRSIEEAYGLGLLGGAATGANGDLVALFGGPAA